MALSINWLTKVITVPRADMTLVQASPEIRELDVNAFRLELKAIMDDIGMPYVDTHRHNTEVLLSGILYARTFEIINGYTVEFEDAQYTVRSIGANHNIADVKVSNQVSLITNNSAGLIVTDTSGLTAEEAADLKLIVKILRNRTVLLEAISDNFTIYDDDNVTPLLTHTVTDKNGNVISVPDGYPMERSKGV